MKTEYFDSITKRTASILLTLAISFALFACSEIGGRDNPVDPGYIGDLEVGFMTDSRDGQVYRTVKIGRQLWMAENLNYVYEGKSSENYCSNKRRELCKKYGRMYEWAAAMEACPAGWHLPNDTEWNILWNAVGGTGVAGKKLKTTVGWYDGGDGNDSVSFAVLPAGLTTVSDVLGEDNYAFFWSASSIDNHRAYGWFFTYGNDKVASSYRGKEDLNSVRCLWNYDAQSVTFSSSSRALPTSSSSSVILSESEGSSGFSIKYGLLTDTRDGQVYKTVQIGSWTWMAENLNYAYKGAMYNHDGYTTDSTSWCYDNQVSNCDKYGRLYEWSAAMKACPSGWHLPSDMEWSTLWNIVGGTSAAGRWLKSTSGWYGGGNGTDSFGFAVLPAGIRDNEGRYSSLDNRTYFWSSNESNSNDAFYWDFYYIYDYVYHYSDNKLAGFSVRCLKD